MKTLKSISEGAARDCITIMVQTFTLLLDLPHTPSDHRFGDAKRAIRGIILDAEFEMQKVRMREEPTQ
jgi:hypothetical protein